MREWLVLLTERDRLLREHLNQVGIAPLDCTATVLVENFEGVNFRAIQYSVLFGNFSG